MPEYENIPPNSKLYSKPALRLIMAPYDKPPIHIFFESICLTS